MLSRRRAVTRESVEQAYSFPWLNCFITHNPDLAVVCDADQLVRAYIDEGDGNRVCYESGALENLAFNTHVINVLEGTEPAIRMRVEDSAPIA